MIHIIAKNVRYTEWKLLQRNLDKQSFFARGNVASRLATTEKNHMSFLDVDNAQIAVFWNNL